MDDMMRTEFESRGNPCLASRAPTNLCAGDCQLGPGGSVDGPADAPAHRQRVVGGIYDGVDLLIADVAGNQLKQICTTQVLHLFHL
jgi:hypothetical protein